MPSQSANRLPALKGNESVVRKKNPGYEIVEPIRQPKDLVTYRKAGPGVVDPIENAENQLQFLQTEFSAWLDEDCTRLRQTWDALGTDPANSDKFLDFHKAVHTIAGNAAILDCPDASNVARPLARMLERRPNIEDHMKLVDSAVNAICAASHTTKSDEDPRMAEIIEGLNTIVARWIERM